MVDVPIRPGTRSGVRIELDGRLPVATDQKVRVRVPSERHWEHPYRTARMYPAHTSPTTAELSRAVYAPAQHRVRVLVPEHEQLDIFRPVIAKRQDGQAE